MSKQKERTTSDVEALELILRTQHLETVPWLREFHEKLIVEKDKVILSALRTLHDTSLREQRELWMKEAEVLLKVLNLLENNKYGKP